MVGVGLLVLGVLVGSCVTYASVAHHNNDLVEELLHQNDLLREGCYSALSRMERED
jgi:hypothetical protein